MADVEYSETAQAHVSAYKPSVTNWAGAVISVGLLAGLGVWGYKLAVRDVSGIPVVRALEGPMRVQPDDPGGEQVLHQGLAVNTVKAEGQAAPAADTLILAPPPVDLIAADQPVAGSRPPAQRVVVQEPVPEEESPIMAALRIANESFPDDAAFPDASTAVAVTPVIAVSVPGVARSPRPRPRPGRAGAALVETESESGAVTVAPATAAAGAGDATDGAAATPASVVAANVSGDVDPASIAPGTSLVQLGAFESAQVAQTEWARITARFSGEFSGKSRVIQQATSGGRSFYRLRAIGFSDLNDARRFCSVLLENNADCIPVVLR